MAPVVVVMVVVCVPVCTNQEKLCAYGAGGRKGSTEHGYLFLKDIKWIEVICQDRGGRVHYDMAFLPCGLPSAGENLFSLWWVFRTSLGPPQGTF